MASDGRRGNFLRLSVFFVVIAAAIIFFHFTGILKPVEDIVASLFKPVQNIFYQSSSLFKGSDTAGRDEQVNSLLAENAQLKERIREFESLEQFQSFSSSHSFEVIPARVIGMSSEESARILIVDRGSNDGVQSGRAVLSREGVLIGKVFQVSGEISKVLLTTDRSSAIASRVQNDFSSPGIVVGQKGLSLQLTLVPQNEAIQPGQIVVTSGLEEGVPKGLVIGKVEKIVSSESDLFQSAFLTPLVKFDRLDVVGVVR